MEPGFPRSAAQFASALPRIAEDPLRLPVSGRPGLSLLTSGEEDALAGVDTGEAHDVQVGQPHLVRFGQRQQLLEASDLGVDLVAARLGGALGGAVHDAGCGAPARRPDTCRPSGRSLGCFLLLARLWLSLSPGLRSAALPPRLLRSALYSSCGAWGAPVGVGGA